jgi:hypothetical protein
MHAAKALKTKLIGLTHTKLLENLKHEVFNDRPSDRIKGGRNIELVDASKVVSFSDKDSNPKGRAAVQGTTQLYTPRRVCACGKLKALRHGMRTTIIGKTNC